MRLTAHKTLEPREQVLHRASIFAGGGSPLVAWLISRNGGSDGVSLVLWNNSIDGHFLISLVLWHDLDIVPGSLTLSIVLHHSNNSVRIYS